MKKFIALCLTLALVLSAAAVLAEAGFTVTPNPPAGINYSYKYNVVLFKGGETSAFMDKYLYDKLTVAAEDVGNDIYVALDDLKAIYAPDFTVTVDGDAISINHVGLTAVITADKAEATIDGNAYTFKNAPKTVDGVVMVPAQELMNVAFAKEIKRIADASGDYFAVQYTNGKAIDAAFFLEDLSVYESALAGTNTTGFVYLTYTIEDDPDQKVLPVRIYIPSTYNPDVPMRTILCLHGWSVSQNYFWKDTQRAIQDFRAFESYAEEFGYIIVTPSAYLVGGQYGDLTGAPYMAINERYGQVADAWDIPNEETAELRIRSEKSAMTALELVKSEYNVDEEHLYLMGNSMGGIGTFVLGNKYYEMWDAIAPSGMMINMKFVGENLYPNLVDMPILFTEGTDDQYGFDLAMENFAILATYLNDTRTSAAEGGVHNTGWCIGLPQIFEFFNAQY